MKHLFNDLVDELGVLQETLQRLSIREQELKDLLLLTRYPEIKGIQFKATVTKEPVDIRIEKI